MPLLARVSDRYGRRIVIYLAWPASPPGSVITAHAHIGRRARHRPCLQGLAGGALLPVTLALAADLFAEAPGPGSSAASAPPRNSAACSARCTASRLAALVGWRGIFWINIPLAVLAALAVHRAVPAGSALAPGGDAGRASMWSAACCSRSRLAAARRRAQQPAPGQGRAAVLGPGNARGRRRRPGRCSSCGRCSARTKLLRPAQPSRKAPFFASLGASFCAGAALLVTLVFVQLDAQTVLNKSATSATLLLARFLIALPIGAVIGGFLVRRLGERWVTRRRAG